MVEYYLIDLAKYNKYYEKIIKCEVVYLFDEGYGLDEFSPVLISSSDYKKLNFVGDFIVIYTKLDVRSLKKIILVKMGIFNAGSSKKLFRFYDPRVLLIFLENLNVDKIEVILGGFDRLVICVYDRVKCFSFSNSLEVSRVNLKLSEKDKKCIEESRKNYLVYDFYFLQKNYYKFKLNFIRDLLNFMFSINIYSFFEVSRILDLFGNNKLMFNELILKYEFLYEVDTPDSIRVNQLILKIADEESNNG